MRVAAGHRECRIGSPLDYLVAVTAGTAGDDSAEGAAAWAAPAPTRILHRLGGPATPQVTPAVRTPRPSPGSSATPAHAQHADDVLCAWAAARAVTCGPGMRKHLRVDGKALRGAVRGGRIPMLLSGLWDDASTTAQFPAHGKTNGACQTE